MNIKVNYAKTRLPLSISKGTNEQRLQKARLLNLRFYDLLQEKIKNNTIAPGTFARTLNDTLGEKLGIEITGNHTNNDSGVFYKINQKLVCNGYFLKLPFANFEDKIHKSSAPIFLKETQNLFNEIFNPKLMNRAFILINKGCKLDVIIDFYNKNIQKTSSLTEENLNSFLSKIPNKFRIDVLQYFRYKLLSEQSTEKAAFQIDKSIEKHNQIKFVRSSDFYDLNKYNYDNKFEILNKTLFESIQAQKTS